MRKNRLSAVLLLRCPVCLEGRTFRSLLGMYKHCPQCGILYEREHGYFLNSMFFAYVLGFLLIAPTAIYLYVRGVSMLWFTVIISAELLLLWPFIFRYSRVLWMHADQLLDPRGLREEIALEIAAQDAVAPAPHEQQS
jgi:uncharacterized protein (DUF983 family)